MSTKVSEDLRRVLGLVLDMTPAQRSAFWLHDLDTPARKELLKAARLDLGTPFGLWRDDRVGFVVDALGVNLYAAQRRILSALDANDRVAVPSAHGAGKTFVASYCVAHHLMCHSPGTALAPTASEVWWKVKAQLWAEIGRMHRRHNLPGDVLTTQWKLGDELVSWGLSPQDQNEEAFSGVHAPHVLLVIDEAGRLAPAVGQSIESVMSTEGAKCLVIGNPPTDETASPWFEDRTLSAWWTTERISTFDTPNFTDEPTDLCSVHPFEDPHPVSAHLPTPQSVQVIEEEYGTDSAYYIARVLAQFPKDFGQRAIPRSWVEDACENDSGDITRVMAREPEPGDSTWVRLGVDVAADGGDEFVVARGEGNVYRVVRNQRPPQGVSTFTLAGWVLEDIMEAERVRAELGEERPVRVKIDALGLGMGVSDALTAWGEEGRHNAEIVAVKVSEAPTSKTRAGTEFANQRAQMWWNGRELMQPYNPEGGDTPMPGTVRLVVAGTDDRLVQQLSAPSYDTNSSGRLTIEKKDRMKARGVASPDRAEAVLLAMFESRPRAEATFSRYTGTLPSAPTR